MKNECKGMSGKSRCTCGECKSNDGKSKGKSKGKSRSVK